jgi:hypothetical protein
VELTEVWPSVAPGHGGMPWGGEKEGTTGSLFWLVSRLGRRRTDGGTFAQKGDGVVVVRAKRRRVGGVGIFTEGGRRLL